MDAFVAQHLHGVSRTYAILVPMLPRPLDDAVGIAYLLMRVVDTLEDATELATDERLRRLRLLERALAADGGDVDPHLSDPLGDTDAERALMAVVPDVLARVRALPAAYRDPVARCAGVMSAGVARLTARSAERGRPYPAIRDAAELREYCYYVAGVVGEMLCAMMAHFLRLPSLLRLRDLAVELGTGLQLVNILKDALRDAETGRCYLPLAEGGAVAHAEIYRAVLQEARHSLQKGIDFVLALPSAARELRSFCGLPIVWGAMTLAKAETNAAAAKIGRGAVQASIELFRKVAGDDAELRRWLHGLLWPGEKPAAA